MSRGAGLRSFCRSIIPVDTGHGGYDLLRLHTRKATLIIIGINVVVYLFTSFRNFFVSTADFFVSLGGFIPALALRLDQAYRYATSMFIHADIFHIFFNMYFLYIFGKGVESALGSKRFLVLYFVSGLGASVFHTIFSLLQGVEALAIPAVGASGAISGVLGAYMILYPGTALSACFFYFFFPVCFTTKAVYFLLFWFATQVIYGYARMGLSVAVFAHAGGFLTGMALLALVANRDRIEVLRAMARSGVFFDFIAYSYEDIYGPSISPLAKLVAGVMIVAMALTSLGLFLNYYGDPSSYNILYMEADTVLYRGIGGYRAAIGGGEGYALMALRILEKEPEVIGTLGDTYTQTFLKWLWDKGYLYSLSKAGRSTEVKYETPEGTFVQALIRYDEHGIAAEAEGKAYLKILSRTGFTGIYIEFTWFRLSSSGYVELRRLVAPFSLITTFLCIAALLVLLAGHSVLEIV
ncbi:MAG: hypothetical protein DRO12_03690 [Thermoprotei archaeon]|nr:MAG: hypothetical protein DRO12_03690 [Thermoprotei archaeon]